DPLPITTAKRVGGFAAGWSSPVARQAHNLKVVGSNPAPATNRKKPFPTGNGFFAFGAHVGLNSGRVALGVAGEARMALLIINLDKVIAPAEAWREAFKKQVPDLPIRFWPDAGEAKDIEYLAFMHPDFGELPVFPNLKAMFSRSAGVEAFVNHPKLPKVPLGKMEPPGGDPMMTEYVVMHVLRFHRDMPGYQAAQANREWRRVPIVRPDQRRVGFLGYGMMAKAPAVVLQSLGFKVSAWVRSPRPAAEVPIFHGRDQLA